MVDYKLYWAKSELDRLWELAGKIAKYKPVHDVGLNVHFGGVPCAAELCMDQEEQEYYVSLEYRGDWYKLPDDRNKLIGVMVGG